MSPTPRDRGSPSAFREIRRQAEPSAELVGSGDEPAFNWSPVAKAVGLLILPREFLGVCLRDAFAMSESGQWRRTHSLREVLCGSLRGESAEKNSLARTGTGQASRKTSPGTVCPGSSSLCRLKKWTSHGPDQAATRGAHR